MRTLKEKSNVLETIIDTTDSTYNITVKVWKKGNIVTVYISTSSLATAIAKGTITTTLATLPERK